MEVMANSNNVIRGGQNKHVDVAELLNNATKNCGEIIPPGPVPRFVHLRRPGN
jgi:mannose-6-phosphate isomerase class I